MILQARSVGQAVSLILVSAFFVFVGVNHFLNPAFFEAIVPPYLPSPRLLVDLSGVCEIAGGIGILVPALRQPARWGLIALLIAVFPANLHMALNPQPFVDSGFPLWALYLRLPLQGVLILWVFWSGKPATRTVGQDGHESSPA